MKKTKIFSLLFFVLFGFFAVSCNQNLLGAGQAVKNFITTPFRGIKSAISNHTYSRLREKTLKKNESENENISCETKSSPSPMDPRGVASLLEEVRKQACECKEWGTCTAQACPCEKLCPEDLSILRRRAVRENSRPENSLSFRNSLWMSDKHPGTSGYCWGHASVTSQFNRMAFFKKSAKAPFNLHSASREEQNKAIEYYKEKIDAILDNEATDIEGFANLREFSSHPAIQSYLGDRVAEVWADKAMTFQGLKTVMQSSPQSKDDNEKFVKNVKDKLDLGQQPQIVFTARGAMGMTHAVLVSHYVVENGKTVLCLRDNNYGARGNYNCQNKLYLTSSGTVRYNQWGGIGGIKLAHNDNQDAVAQVDSLVEKCKSEKGCDKEE